MNWKAVVWSSNENDNSLDAIGLCKCDWFLSRLSRKHMKRSYFDHNFLLRWKNYMDLRTLYSSYPLAYVFKLAVFFFQNHTSSCEYLKIPCVYCGVMVKKADLTDHLQKECMFRLETCGFCKKQIPLNRMKVHSSKLLSSHCSYDLIRLFLSWTWVEQGLLLWPG